ncbi:MAG: hypothetical protein WBB76_10235 [Gaiellaceae bacterium]
MKRNYLLILAVPVVTALVLAGTALGHTSKTPTLKGVVGPGFTISLKMGGKNVTKLKAGSYKFVITDKAAIHNYTVEREKPSKPKLETHATSTPFTGTKTVVINLKPGSWRAYCSVHEAQMQVNFKVTK